MKIYSINAKSENMKALEIKENWNDQKTNLKQRLLALLGTELNVAEHRQTEYLGQLPGKLVKSKELLSMIMRAI
jgi:hypothetical protein